MITLSQLTELLGWASLINMVVLLIATVSLLLLRQSVGAIHRRLFPINEQELTQQYFGFLANYKMITLAFFVVPYLSLKLMGQ